MNLMHWLPGILLMVLSTHAYSADPALQGARLYASCAGCHGTNGQAVGDALPELAGRPQQELIAAMRAFTSGTREATIMHQIAKAYSEAQIAQIAAFLALQPGSTKK